MQFLRLMFGELMFSELTFSELIRSFLNSFTPSFVNSSASARVGQRRVYLPMEKPSLGTIKQTTPNSAMTIQMIYAICLGLIGLVLFTQIVQWRLPTFAIGPQRYCFFMKYAK